MDNKTNKDGKKEKILKGATYAGAAGVGAMGTMAFASPEHDGQVDGPVLNGPNDLASDKSDNATEKDNSHAENDTIVAQLTEEQVDELKAELREEMRAELLHDEDFIDEIKHTIVEEPPAPHEPEIEVLDYSTVTAADGSTADIATLKIDGTHAALIDIDQDGYADGMIVDSNGNQRLDEGDYTENVVGRGIAMAPLCSAAHQHDGELLAGDGEHIENTDGEDFVNDADTSEFLA